MPHEEIEKLLESPIHEVRAGAASIMYWQARGKKTPESRRKELFDLYIRRHDRINDWDLVDRSAPYAELLFTHEEGWKVAPDVVYRVPLSICSLLLSL